MPDTKITMEVIDTTAQEAASPGSSDQMLWWGPVQLKFPQPLYKKFITLEDGFAVMDGTFEPFPDDPYRAEYVSGEILPDGIQYGWWTKSFSNAEGLFSVSPVLKITWVSAHTSMGLTLHWYDDVPLKINIRWYSGWEDNSLIYSRDYMVDSADFTAEGFVSGYKRIDLTVLKTKPFRQAKLYGIDYGYNISWSEGSVIFAKVLEEVDPISAELSVNTLNFELQGKQGEFNILRPSGVYQSFQQQQPVKVQYTEDGNSKDMGTFYLDTWEGQDNDTGSFTAVDAIGVLDKTNFYGAVFNNTPASDAVKKVMDSAGWTKYELAEDLKSILVSGIIEPCTHREALQQIAFSLMAIVEDNRSDTIRIHRTPRTYGHLITRDRKIIGGKIKQDKNITRVDVTAHQFVLGTQREELFKDTLQPGINLVQLSDPAAEVQSETENATTGGNMPDAPDSPYYVMVKVGSEEAIEVTLTGLVYQDMSTLYSAGSAAIEENIASVEAATLITPGIAQEVAAHVLDYYLQRYELTNTVIPQEESSGEKIAVQLADGNDYVEGTIIGMDVDITGGFIANTTIISTGKSLKVVSYCGELYAGQQLGVI